MPHSSQDRTHTRFQGFLSGHLSLLIPFLFLSLLSGFSYSVVIPPWQAPDEPGHLEYAIRLAEKRWLVNKEDMSLELQREILLSMKQHDFWRHVGREEPETIPESFFDDRFLVRSGSQLGDDSPLYYIIPALTFTLLGSPDILLQLYITRWFSVILSSGTVVVSCLVAGELFSKDRFMMVAIPSFVVFLPMFAFIGASANNDALATLLASLFVWQLVRALRRGVSWRSGLAICTLALLSLLAKKTAFFVVPLLVVGVPLYLCGRRLAVSYGHRSVAAASCLLAALLLGAVLTWGGGDAAQWVEEPEPWMDARSDHVARSGSYSLHIVDDTPQLSRRLVQSLPFNSVRELRGRTVTLNAWARSANGEQRGSLLIVDSEARSTQTFGAAETWNLQSLTHTISSEAKFISVVLRPSAWGKEGTGDLYFDDVALVEGGWEGTNFVSNGSGEATALRVWPRLERLSRYVSLRRLFDARSYDASSLKRYALYSLLTFAGFWANFGWLTLPLDPAWYALLASVSLTAVIGLGLFGARIAGQWKHDRDSLPTWQKKSLFLLLMGFCLILLQTFLPMIGRDWQPQGRYLFPAIIPIATLFSLGWSELVSRRLHSLLAIAWTVVFCLLHIACLYGYVLPYFYG